MGQLRYLTAGESHGRGGLVVVEGMPAGVPISADIINDELKRRQGGYGRGARMKIEKDAVDLYSGIRFGLSIGSPIALLVQNRDWENWEAEMTALPSELESKKKVLHPRPGHADLAGGLKYNFQADLRPVLERASARETVVRVAAGAVARQLLAVFGIQVYGHVVKIGAVANTSPYPAICELKKLAEASDLRCFDAGSSQKMKAKIDEAKGRGDSVGGVFEVIVTGLPPGLGSYVQWDRKLDGRLAQALMSIQAIKGVELGLGFQVAERFGSEVHDEIFYDNEKRSFEHRTNGAGGLEGGVTNGEWLVVRAAMKPISTLYRPLHSVDIHSKEAVKASVERSDHCAVPAACVIGENVTAFTLADAFLEKFGGDSLEEIKRNYDGYLQQLRQF